MAPLSSLSINISSMKDKLLALGDSNITAEFQRICGIVRHTEVPKSKSNGVKVKCNGSVNHNGSVFGGLSRSNGSATIVKNGTNVATTNGHDSPGKAMSNGHLHGHSNGVKNGSVTPLKNGFLKERNVAHKNGFNKSHTNGIIPVQPCTECIQPKSDTVVTQNGHIHETSSHLKQPPIANGHSVKQATSDSDDVTLPYSIENTLLYYVFTFGASLGNEIFYILFFSSTLWNFDSFVVRKVLIVWCVVMYVGQAAKDIIRWPRPLSPPAVHLEERYGLEYGMPSTHAMVGVVIPFGMIIYMSGRYEFHLLGGIIFAITWSVLVSFSRLYLGMHSALDILAGLVFAVLLMAVTIPFVDPVDEFLISHPYALPVLVSVGIGLCLMYPSLDKWSTARGDTTQVMAVFSGIYAGLWLTGKLSDYQTTPDTPPFILGLPAADEAYLAALRQIVGVVTVVTILMTMKTKIHNGLSWLTGLDPLCPLTKQRLLIELPYKYLTYFTTSTIATYVMPLVFLKLNIERPSYYSEISEI